MTNIKDSLIRVVRPLAKIVMNSIPGGRKLAWSLYQFLTPNGERWVDVHGVPILVNIHDNGIGTLLFFRGQYAVARVSEIRQLVKEGDVAVDIGANIGYFTALLANLVGQKGKVYAFEPDPRNFQLLQRTIQRNGWTHVIAYQKAVADKNGEFILYQTRSWTANVLTPSEHISTAKVDVVILDEFLTDEKCIDFVKMDMDGSEPLAIRGMTKLIRRNPNLKVLAEYQPGNLKRYLSDPLDFITIAEEHGLNLATILNSDTGRLPQLDVAPLKQLTDNENLDLLFTTSNSME